MPKVKYRRLTEDEEKFIKSYAAGHSREEITNALNKKFQTDVLKWKVEYFLSDNKITTGYATGHKYSKDEICFLEAYAPSHSLNEIQIAFNDKFKLNIKKGALSQCMLRKNIKPGITTRFKKNQVPKNKRPIGFESIQKSSNGIKYVFIKTELPDKWEMKHLFVYKNAYGQIPENSTVIFLDGNTLNTNLDNLMAIDKRIHAIMNKYQLPRKTKEETLASIQIATLIAGIKDAEKRFHPKGRRKDIDTKKMKDSIKCKERYKHE